MHAQVVAAVQAERGSVPPVQLDEVLAAGDVAGVVGHGDHEVEDDIVGEEVEEVFAVRVSAQAFLDDAENGPRAWKSSKLSITALAPTRISLNVALPGMPPHHQIKIGGTAMGKEARVGLLLGATCCLLAVMVDWVVEDLHK